MGIAILVLLSMLVGGVIEWCVEHVWCKQEKPLDSKEAIHALHMFYHDVRRTK